MRLINFKIKNHQIFIYYLGIFLCLFFFTLNTNYVEGDDASTILYHLCGRDSNIQLPYAPYNSGFDFILSFLPIDEVILRNFSVYISFIFGFAVLFLSFVILKLILEKSNKKINYLFFYLLPFIIPDFIFHSLIINPTNISFAFALLSLIFFLRVEESKYNIVLSTIFMAIAIPFRWSMLLFYPLFFSISVLMCHSRNDVILLLKRIFFHHFTSFFLGLIFILITGYSMIDVYQIILWGNSYMEGKEVSVLSLLATGSAFLTPSFVLLVLLALIETIKTEKYKNLKFYFLLFPFLPFLLLGFSPSFKFLITLIPILLLFIYFGFDYVSRNRVLSVTIFSSILIVWVVGIKLDVSGSLYGDGFGFKSNLMKMNQNVNEKNTDERIKIKSVNPALDGGFYMPMLEGPRPLYGYCYVLFGGLWKKNIEDFANTRNLIVRKIMADSTVYYLQDRKTAFVQSDFFRFGLKTNTNFVENKTGCYRKFYNDSKIVRLNIVPNDVSKLDFVIQKMKVNKKVVFRSSYPSLILSVYNSCNNAIILDPFTITNIQNL